MNYGTFAGRLGHDAELKTIPSGQSVAEFSVAVNTGWGERKKTLWVKCALWGERGEKLAPYLKKGGAVTVSGDVDVNAFSSKDGTLKAEITLNVQRVTLQGDASAKSEQRHDAPAAKPVSQPAAPAEGFDDDLNF